MKILPWVNFAGVLLLGAFCVAQWRQNRELNLEINALERHSQQQSARLQERESDLQGTRSDLAELKGRLDRAASAAGEAQHALNAAHSELRRVGAERDELRGGLTNWMAAVRARDDSLLKATDEVNRLAAGLNRQIVAYNELASNHNALVTNWNAVMQKSGTNAAGPVAR